jgi:hypothetical protein
VNAYLRISAETARELFEDLSQDPTCQLRDYQPEIRGGSQLAKGCAGSDFSQIMNRWREILSEGRSDRTEIEAMLSTDMYDLVSGAPADALADVGYWRWIAADPMRDFVLWRGAKKKGLPSSAAFAQAAMRHSALVESVPYRMYLQGRIATEASLMDSRIDRESMVISGGHDTWMSHILRGKSGRFPLYVAAFLEGCQDQPIEVIREAAKHVNRVGAQVSRASMNLDEARVAVRDAFGLILGSQNQKR